MKNELFGLLQFLNYFFIFISLPELIQFPVTCEYVGEVERHPPRRDFDEEVPLVLGQDGGDPLQDAALTTLHVRADLPGQPRRQVHAQTRLHGPSTVGRYKSVFTLRIFAVYFCYVINARIINVAL